METEQNSPSLVLYAFLCTGAGILTAIFVILYIQLGVLSILGPAEPSEGIFNMLRAFTFILHGAAFVLSIVAWRKHLKYAVPVLACAAYFLLTTILVLSIFN